MVDADQFRKLAISFPGAIEKPHFERTSFRVKGKIFATLAESTNFATLNLSMSDQAEFCIIDRQSIYPVPNSWGQKGWTLAELNQLSEELVLEMLTSALNKTTN